MLPLSPSLALVFIITITQSSLFTSSFSSDHHHHRTTIFHLTAEQCPHLATIFTSSGLTRATYLDSCSARFLHLDRLYDDALLLSVSLDAWHHGNRTVVNLATLAQQITGSRMGGVFDYLNAALVVRVDDCGGSRAVEPTSSSSTTKSRTVTVRISPTPRLSENSGLASVELTAEGVGELLVTSGHRQSELSSGFRPDIYEVTLVDDSQRCSLANTRLLVCGKLPSADQPDQQQQPQQSNCQVDLFDADQRLVECRCESSTDDVLFVRSQYLFALVVAVYLLLLTLASLMIKASSKAASAEEDEEEAGEQVQQEEGTDKLIINQQQLKQNFTGLTEEHVMGNVASRAHAYHYQVIYRVACPTVHFDVRATISFQVLGGSPLRPLFASVGFAMAASDDDDDDPSGLHWNVFTTDVFLPIPLAKVRAVRTSHDGRPHTGLFLFDVHVYFIRKPLLVELMEEDNEEDSDADLRRSPPRSPKAAAAAEVLLPEKGRKAAFKRPQRLPIYAYILDHPNVYLKAEKGAPIELPPSVGKPATSDLPTPSLPYLKVLAWLATAEALLLSSLALEQLYLRFDMLLACVLAAVAIAAAILLQLTFTIWLHGRLCAESLHHQLLYECLADRGEEEESLDKQEGEDDGKERRRKTKKKLKKKKKFKGKSRPKYSQPWNCGHLLDTLLLLLLLGATAACLGTLLLSEHHFLEQPPLRAVYAEAVTLLSLVLVAGSLWLLLGGGGFCCSRRLLQSRIAAEERLMAESKLRGGGLSQQSTMTNASDSRTTTKTRTRSTEKKKKKRSSGRKSATSSSPAGTSATTTTTLATPKGTFKMISLDMSS